MKRIIRLPCLLLGTTLLVAACADPEPQEAGAEAAADGPALDAASQPAAQPAERTHVFVCGEGYRFTVSVEGEQATLSLPDTTLTLAHVPSASGAKYSSSMGDVTFWNQGDEALLEMPTASYEGCQRSDAGAAPEAAHGTGFRALGNEPGWNLEIAEQITLMTDYGENQLTFPAPEPQTDAQGTTTYETQADGHTLTLQVLDEPCQDAMSGEAFEKTVTVVVDGKEYYGCGESLPLSPAPQHR